MERNYIPGFYQGAGENSRTPVRKIGDVMFLKPEWYGGNPLKVKQQRQKKIGIDAELDFKIIWNLLPNSGNQDSDVVAEAKYNELQKLIPKINTLNIKVLAIAQFLINQIGITKKDDLIEKVKKISREYDPAWDQLQNLGSNFFLNKSSNSNTKKEIMNDVIRYISLILTLQEAQKDKTDSEETDSSEEVVNDDIDTFI